MLTLNKSDQEYQDSIQGKYPRICKLANFVHLPSKKCMTKSVSLQSYIERYLRTAKEYLAKK